MNKSLILLCVGLVALGQQAQSSTVADALAAIDPATGAAKDTATVFDLDAVVAARTTLADGKVLAFLKTPTTKAGLAVVADAAETAKFLPRNELTLKGQVAAGPFGWAVLNVAAGSVAVVGDNKPFGSSTPVNGAAFADASALAGQFVQLTNVTFEGDKFAVKSGVKVKDATGAEVALVVSASVDGRDVPVGGQNVYGVPVKVDGGWKLLAARFLPVTGKATLALAEHHTCTTCHNPDAKVVGPAYRDVAQKYRNDNDAVAKFMAQMDAGGLGKWGQVPMPAFKDKVPAADEKQLAEWIWGYRWDWILAE